ncbi:DEAD/DEAH box helicase [uncultured Shewanella sp.]|uniref:DEAD/DEAH box helicase n=1 Tax=uncultured Shewanella sp. TaxID=173975 RepID=UPI00261F4EB7|nr:DEAD/DEAH box helicase [uncultured Shewanella sp.]
MSFSSIGLMPELVSRLSTLGYTDPTPIQSLAVPAILAGQDVMGKAQTGTGKTAAFTLPILQHLVSARQAFEKSVDNSSDNSANNSVSHSVNGECQKKKQAVGALILTPTRELAIQVHKSVNTYAQDLLLSRVEGGAEQQSGSGFCCALIYGGVSIDKQAAVLAQGCDIIVATPGRLLDHLSRGNLSLNTLDFLVLDEADRMLDLGFKDDINSILKALPKRASGINKKRQTLFFSATFNPSVFNLSQKWLNKPTLIEMDEKNRVASQVEQIVYQVDSDKKTAVICHLINKDRRHIEAVHSSLESQVLIFCRKRQGVDQLVQALQTQGIEAQALHGDLSQSVREQVLTQFKQADVQVLVATDVAARGLDIETLNTVINYELPFKAEDYVHRIGRTGRAGNSGKAITLYNEEDALLLEQIETLLDTRLPQQWLTGFEPDLTKSTPVDYKNTKSAQKKRARRRALNHRKR